MFMSDGLFRETSSLPAHLERRGVPPRNPSALNYAVRVLVLSPKLYFLIELPIRMLTMAGNKF